MIGLDTNVLVRYIADDDPDQSPRAARLIEALTPHEPGFVSIVALAETVWVLGRAYRFSRGQIATAIERMLRADSLVVERAAEVFTAMISLRQGRGEFADALIAALGESAGCSHTVTFDRAALGLTGFAAL